MIEHSWIDRFMYFTAMNTGSPDLHTACINLASSACRCSFHPEYHESRKPRHKLDIADIDEAKAAGQTVRHTVTTAGESCTTAQCAYSMTVTAYSDHKKWVFIVVNHAQHTRKGETTPCHGPHANAARLRLQCALQYSPQCQAFGVALMQTKTNVKEIVHRTLPDACAV